MIYLYGQLVWYVPVGSSCYRERPPKHSGRNTLNSAGHCLTHSIKWRIGKLYTLSCKLQIFKFWMSPILSLLVMTLSSADNLCKQFGPRSGPTECRSRFGSKPFDTLTVFLKEFFEKVNLEKSQHEKIPNMQNWANQQMWHNFTEEANYPHNVGWCHYLVHEKINASFDVV